MKKRAPAKSASRSKKRSKSRAARPRPAAVTPGQKERTDPLPVPDAANPLGIRAPLDEVSDGGRQTDPQADPEHITPALDREDKGTPQ